MGKSGEFKRPEIGEGPLKKLNEALHELHLNAGLPSLGELYKAMGKTIGRSTLHDAFTGTERPSWRVVDALVEVLATRSPRTSPECEIERFHQLWTDAARSKATESSALVYDHSAQRKSLPSSYWIMSIDGQGQTAATASSQVEVQRRLLGDISEALEFAGISEFSEHVNFGDRVQIIISAQVVRAESILGFLLHFQRLLLLPHSSLPDLRARLVVASGEVMSTESGWLGLDIVRSARLVDSSELRSLMASSPMTLLAVILTPGAYEALFTGAHRGFRPQVRPMEIQTKEGMISAWGYTVESSAS